jgi:hypothetical protein
MAAPDGLRCDPALVRFIDFVVYSFRDSLYFSGPWSMDSSLISPSALLQLGW